MTPDRPDLHHPLQRLGSAADPPPSEAVGEFLAACAADGIGAALEALNRRVLHRYTAIYRLEGALLRNVALVDKAQQMRPEFLAEVPLATSFCQFVLKDGVFLTADSAGDDRLDGHPYKGVMVAYHGVPIPDADDKVFGTLCHFDVAEQALSDAEFDNLQNIARVVRPYL
jgi:GAF domain-containing protein